MLAGVRRRRFGSLGFTPKRCFHSKSHAERPCPRLRGTDLGYPSRLQTNVLLVIRSAGIPVFIERRLCANSGPSAWAPPKYAIRPFALIRPPSSASISVSLFLQSGELACFL